MHKIFAAAAIAILPATAQAAPPPRPKLIVAIAVDQLSGELFARYRDSYTGGLRTLSQGIAYANGYQSHAATETCPGHATILTGRHPSGNGIVANNWFDMKTGATVYCASVPGSAERDARGHQNLRVTTLGDWIKAAEPGARSFAVSAKDRSAIMMAGKRADGVYWWVDGTGFATSRFAGPADDRTIEPARAFNRALMARWQAAAPMLWPRPSPACARLQQPHRFGEMDLSGTVPPEFAAGATAGEDFLAKPLFHKNLRSSPLLDSVTIDFAEQLIAREGLGRGPATDMLSISLSGTDYIGHRYGNGGAEMCVQQAELDGMLARLLAGLKGLGVPVMVVLTADHGAADAAERSDDHGDKPFRLDEVAFANRLNLAMREKFGLPYAPIIGDDLQQLVIRADHDAALAVKLRDAAIAWLRQQPEVREAYTRAEVEAATVPAGTTPDRLTMLQRFNRSYDPDRSGDIAVVYGARASFGVPRKMGDSVAGHGTPWDHDRRVPILFWWPDVTSEPRDQPVEVVDIAPTLADVAGITPPVPVDGRCLDLGGNCPR